jgi:hypothetical protein
MGSQGGMLQAGASEERGENARMSSFVGALAIADLVKSTLGPKGMVRGRGGGSWRRRARVFARRPRARA